jgi:dTDP-4-amino-4,6-dideoxygalactose transaminase
MHLLSIPRHQLETTPGEYARIVASLMGGVAGEDEFGPFEREFAAYIGCRHAIAVSSGRLAMHLILDELQPTTGDEAIVPAFNLFAVIERFRQLGITPRFCDARPDNLNLDLAAAERLLTPKTRFLLVTHMYGHSADMDAVRRFADRHGLIILEDCAHALGSKFGGRYVGTFGKAAIFSFSVLKLVTTFGGGMITTDDDDLASGIRGRLRSLRDHRPPPPGLKRALTGAILDIGTRKMIFSLGAWPLLRLLRGVKPGIQRDMMTEKPHRVADFDPIRVAHMHPFQAALGRSQLARAEDIIARRGEVCAWLDEALADIGPVTRLCRNQAGRHNGLYYGILVDRPAELSSYLFKHGIDSETSEYLNCADLDIYRDYYTDCPAARDIQNRILRLPNFPSLSRKDVGRIARAIRGFYDR